MAANKVLLVDDDQGIIEVLKLYFEKEGYQVSTCMQGDKAVGAFQSFAPDIVILDLMLPGMDGNDICREIRKTSDVPIIMLTARDSDADYIEGLNLGSDDYFTKPFSPIKLVTKVKSLFARLEASHNINVDASDSELVFADLKINRKTKSATLKGNEINLTPNEYTLLTYLMINSDRAVPRVELLDKIWGYETEIETRVADDTVKRLRKKISDSDARISTVWGYGFRLTDKSEQESDEAGE